MEDRGGEERRKIEKNRKFGNQKVSKVVGEKKKVAWQMLQHRLTHARRFHDNNNLVSLSCRNSTFQEGAHRGSSALFGTETPTERRLDLCVCLGTPHEHNNGGTLLQNKPLEMYLLSIIYVPPLGLKGGSEICVIRSLMSCSQLPFTPVTMDFCGVAETKQIKLYENVHRERKLPRVPLKLTSDWCI